MGKVTEEEINIVSAMYEGDVKRDASSKIRGFIYQDYIAVMCLLKENVECVCSEYIEDVDVFKDDGTFEFIQVKYYPKANPDYKEIFTDLYYQFLRLKILDSAMIPKPNLYIHGTPNLNKPTVDAISGIVYKTVFIGLVNIEKMFCPINSYCSCLIRTGIRCFFKTIKIKF